MPGFWPTECQAGYITMAREVTSSRGIPTCFYHDRHTILCSPKEQTIEDELAGREPMSQFQAILAQLGAEAIKALTPQAKGRIERMWQTLQDRLIKEMRLAAVTTMDEANAFLPVFIERYNARFAVEARDQQTAWVKPEEELDLPFFFASKEERMVRSDHTLAWQGKTLSDSEEARGTLACRHTRAGPHDPGGECFVYHGKEPPRLHTVAERPERTADVRASTTPSEREPRLTSAPPEQHDQDQHERRTARRRQMHFVHQGSRTLRTAARTQHETVTTPTPSAGRPGTGDPSQSAYWGVRCRKTAQLARTTSTFVDIIAEQFADIIAEQEHFPAPNPKSTAPRHSLRKHRATPVSRMRTDPILSILLILSKCRLPLFAFIRVHTG